MHIVNGTNNACVIFQRMILNNYSSLHFAAVLRCNVQVFALTLKYIFFRIWVYQDFKK